VCPFLDPVTKSKVEFVYSKDVKKAEDDAAAAGALPAPAARAPGGGVTATVTATVPDSSAARFVPYLKFYRTAFDYDSQVKLLQSFGWRK
jgi:hypothetical protein